MHLNFSPLTAQISCYYSTISILLPLSYGYLIFNAENDHGQCDVARGDGGHGVRAMADMGVFFSCVTRLSTSMTDAIVFSLSLLNDREK